MSPLLFDIGEDFISIYLSILGESDALRYTLAGCSFGAPSHLLYANDILLFPKLLNTICNP